MQLVEGLPTYGVHYYDVKDKAGIPWWLGLSFKGVCQYDRVDRVTPRKIYQWRQLQNIYYRDRKFSIEVTDPRRVVHTLSSFNLYRDALEEPEECFDDLSDAISDPTTQVSVSKRTFGVSNATVHAWYGHPTLIRSMWTMAVNQHQFYLDRKHNKDRYASMQRSFTQIANDLTKSTNSLTSSQASEVSSDPGQQHQTPGKMEDESSEINAAVKEKEKENTSRELLAIEGEAAKKDIVVALKARKSVLQDRLREKLEELKKICVNEAELTGELPLEYPRKPGEQLPKIKKRVATAFTLSAKVVNAGDRTGSQETQNLNQLENEMEIQSKITIAARKLADDPTISKKVRKTRRESYKRSARRLDSIEKKLVDMKQNLGLLPADQTPTEEKVVQSHTLPRKRSVPSTPPLLRPFTIGDRGRNKKKEDKTNRLRSKSVPRQLFENAWRSPSLGRKKDKVPVRPTTPVDIYNDNEPAVPATKPEPPRRERSYKNHQQHVQPQSRTPVCYETSLQSMASLDINHHSDSGSFRDDSSTYSDGSTRSQPEGYMTHPRTSVDHGNHLAKNRQSNFSSSMGDVTAVPPAKTNASRTSPRRGKPPIQRRIDRGPPPPYNNSPAKFRSMSQSGRYYESPEDTLGRADVDAPKLRQHASSMHDLQYALQGNNLPALSDDDLEYHQQATSLSQPPSPKKHASLGNLAMKSNSLPGSDYEEQQLANYGSHRGHKYRSHQYQKYSGQSQDYTHTRYRDESGNYYAQKNSTNRMRNGSGDNQQAYNRNYASLDRLGKSRQEHRPSLDTSESMYYSLDRRGHHIIEDTQISNDSSYASLDRPMHKPPLPSGSIDDVSMTSASRRRHNSFSSQRSTSSYSSQGSSNLSNHQKPRTPLHQTSSGSSRQSEFSVYTSLASLSPSNSFSSNGAGSSSHNSTYSEPQAASMYTTSTPVHLQPKVQQAYGTNIAISKAHYTPAQPMTCEPVSRSTRPSQTSNRRQSRPVATDA